MKRVCTPKCKPCVVSDCDNAIRVLVTSNNKHSPKRERRKRGGQTDITPIAITAMATLCGTPTNIYAQLDCSSWMTTPEGAVIWLSILRIDEHTIQYNTVAYVAYTKHIQQIWYRYAILLKRFCVGWIQKYQIFLFFAYAPQRNIRAKPHECTKKSIRAGLQSHNRHVCTRWTGG